MSYMLSIAVVSVIRLKLYKPVHFQLNRSLPNTSYFLHNIQVWTTKSMTELHTSWAAILKDCQKVKLFLNTLTEIKLYHWIITALSTLLFNIWVQEYVPNGFCVYKVKVNGYHCSVTNIRSHSN